MTPGNWDVEGESWDGLGLREDLDLTPGSAALQSLESSPGSLGNVLKLC